MYIPSCRSNSTRRRFSALSPLKAFRSSRYSWDGTYCIKTLAVQDASKEAKFHGIIKNVEALGGDDSLTWSRDAEGLHIKSSISSNSPVVFKITVD